MSRLHYIAKNLNSSGLDITDDLRRALMECFCEDSNDDDNSYGDAARIAGMMKAIMKTLRIRIQKKPLSSS